MYSILGWLLPLTLNATVAQQGLMDHIDVSLAEYSGNILCNANYGLYLSSKILKEKVTIILLNYLKLSLESSSSTVSSVQYDDSMFGGLSDRGAFDIIQRIAVITKKPFSSKVLLEATCFLEPESAR